MKQKVIFLFFSLLMCANIYAQDGYLGASTESAEAEPYVEPQRRISPEEIENYLGQGYFALSKQDTMAAREAFQTAAELAINMNDWRNALDAAIGLIALREFDDARGLIDHAAIIVDRLNDLRADVAIAHAISALPTEYRSDLSIQQYLSRAYTNGIEADNWKALDEIAHVYAALGRRTDAEHVLDDALEIVVRNRSEAGARDLGDSYAALSLPVKAQQCRQLREQFAQGSAQQAVPPPPEWTPYGDSVAGPEPLPEKSVPVYVDYQQQAPREYRDLDEPARQSYNQWDYFNPYYYGFRHDSLYWDPFWDYDSSHLTIWGETRLGGFVFTDGRYRRRW